MPGNNVSLFQQETGATVSPKFNAMIQAGLGDDLGEGIRGSYGIVSIKGGRFSLKYKGQTNVIMAAPTEPGAPASPVSYIDMVIIKANAFLNKQWYKANYVEGSSELPDCYSLDGKVPSQQSKAMQAETCELCPKNQWGSKIGDNGQKQKACRDTKKLAIVPLADIRNTAFGGAMLFRVPATSLKELSIMADALKGRGYPYNSVAVRMTFDTTVSHPKPLFQALRPLSDAEAELVLEMYNSDGTQRVLADNDVAVEAEVPASAQFVQPQAVQMPQVTPVAPVQPAPVAQAPAPQPAVQPPPAVTVGAIAITPFSGGSPPPVPPASAFVVPGSGQQATLQLSPEQPAEAVAAKKPRRTPVTPVASPQILQLTPETPPEADIPAPAQSQLDNDIGDILKGLSNFGGK